MFVSLIGTPVGIQMWYLSNTGAWVGVVVKALRY